MHCDKRRAFILSPVYNEKRLREQPIPNIKPNQAVHSPNPMENLSGGSNIDVSVKSGNACIENMLSESNDNHSIEFVDESFDCKRFIIIK